AEAQVYLLQFTRHLTMKEGYSAPDFCSGTDGRGPTLPDPVGCAPVSPRSGGERGPLHFSPGRGETDTEGQPMHYRLFLALAFLVTPTLACAAVPAELKSHTALV